MDHPAPLSATTGLDADVVVIGAGIVGLATARALVRARPGIAVAVVDKEDRLAAHQSGRNSGVSHAGIYYRPGSAKATMVAAGRRALEAFVAEHGIAYRRSGKVVVATRPDELERLAELRRRGAAHGVDSRWLDARGLADLEPHVDGIAGLHVPASAVVDFGGVCAALAAEVVDAGGEIVLGRAVTGIERARQAGRNRTGTGTDREGQTGRNPAATSSHGGSGALTVHTDAGPLRAGALVACAGLHADRVAHWAGADTGGVRIAPFRGEYLALRPGADHLVRNLVYPVPDPRFPFLGVHFTRGIDGHVHAGPSAVPALAREGYRWGEVSAHDAREWFAGRAAVGLAWRYGRTGAAEIVRSLWRPAMVSALQRLVPDVRASDLERAPAGVRAQAVAPDGRLLDDFAFARAPRVVCVLNAPSPAATASLEIGRVIAAQLLAERTGEGPG